MKNKLLISTFCFFYIAIVHAQVSINSTSTVTITFGSTIAGVNNGAFTASGFVPVPTAGKFDSDAWSVTGFTDGTLSYGGSTTVGDFARGTFTMLNPTSDAGATVGGIYSYTGSPFSIADPAICLQSDDADFTPGSITLRAINNHPSNSIQQLDVTYNLYVRNNKANSEKFSFSYSTDNITYINVPSLDYTSTFAADVAGVVSAGFKFYSITGINILPSQYIYLRWSVSDVSGIGERDEFYIDAISLAAPTILPVGLTDFTALVNANTIELSWTTLTEINNDFFAIEKSTDGIQFISIANIDGAGNSTETITYQFTDDNPANGINYYRLKQTDFNGDAKYSDVISARLNLPVGVKIYPNPVTDYLYVETGKNSRAEIYAANGLKFWSQQIASSYQINTSYLTAGNYILKIISDDNVQEFTFVKQ